MSILSSTGAGKELAHFNDLYQRRERLYSAYSLFSSLSQSSMRSAVLDVYSREELNFLHDYIIKFKWCKDEKFAKIVIKAKNLLDWFAEQEISSKLSEQITMTINSKILDALEDEMMRFSGIPMRSTYDAREARIHGFRKSSKFF